MDVLGADDPAPVVAFNRQGRSPFLLLGDHAGNAIPTALGTLGLSAADRTRHIAWDIGVRGLGKGLARRLDARFLHQHYSRLVIDCNRDPASPEAIPARSDGSDIPGNAAMGDDEAAARIAAVHTPYHDAIAKALDGGPPMLVALHSFTPAMNGVARPWEIGVLHDGGETSLAHAVLAALRARGDLVVGDNEPYRMDSTDYTIPRHAYGGAGLLYVEIEIRQDLLAAPGDQQRWAAILEQVLVGHVPA